MASSQFISADISKLSKFMSDSEEVIKEFDDIKEKFNSINSTLLDKWKGEGAQAYKIQTDHILENIGGIRDVLDSINNGAVKVLKKSIQSLIISLKSLIEILSQAIVQEVNSYGY